MYHLCLLKMASYLFKKIILPLLSLTLFLFGSAFVFADEIITISAEVISTTPPGPAPTGNTGLGDLIKIPNTAVRFSGHAYPDAIVTILKEGKEKISILADAKGYFSITFEEAYDASVVYTLFAKDPQGNKSVLLNYPIAVYEGYLTHLSGIRFAPTIKLNKLESSTLDSITLFGYALPKENIEIIVEATTLNKDKKLFTVMSNEKGLYKTTFPLLGFFKGEYSVYVRYQGDKRISKLVKFIVGEKDVLNTDQNSNIPGDCNFDSKIDLVDFSVLAFWYKKPNPPICLDTNKDKVINLVDFSILAFYWTG